MNMHAPIGVDRIAIVGMAGRFPGASSVRELWRLLREKREATIWLTDDQLRQAGVAEAEIQDPSYVRASLPLANMESFDAEFFGFNPKDAAILDPQHRQFFETVWEAFEDAGVDPQRFPGAIGVFAGAGQQAYYAANILSNPELVRDVGHFLLRHTGNDKDFLPTRVSYLFNLQGPSLAVQTACSTSLVAAHLACQSLLNGECDMALAGGVTVDLPQGHGYRYKANEILSIDGHCRAFDRDATGTIFGSGVGVVVLRRLSDALRDGDPIRAVICGSAVNNDGSRKAGYLAPSVEGQAQAAVEALSMADIDPETVDYVEAHGTGTIVGDPIELTALSRAYQSAGRTQFCGIGSIKTNIGHLDTAAGIASLIKVVLALEHKEIPATLNYANPNPHFDLAKSPFYVADRAKPWPRTSHPRRAGVNSIGVGGTNAHIIVEEAPAAAPTPPNDSHRLLTLSAKSEAALEGLLNRWSDFLAEPAGEFNLTDTAHSLHHGRRTFTHRCAIVACSADDMARALEERDARSISKGVAADKPDVVFMFPGGGAQFLGAGRQFLQVFPAFRAAVEACFASMPASAPHDLRDAMFPSPSMQKTAANVMQDPRYGLPALFVLEYALSRLWMSWGVKPAGLIGHSSGEYAAAAIAEVVSVRDALEIVCFRAKLFASLPAGAMTAVSLSAEDLRTFVEEDIDVAAINAPQLCVASGPESSISAFEGKMTRIGVDARRLRIDVAAHSRMLDGVLDAFRSRLRTLRFAPPKIPLISNLTGDWIAHSDLTNADYWVQHLRQTVRFSDGVRAAFRGKNRILLEAGPGQQLLALARLNCTEEFRPLALAASTPQADDNQPEQHVLLQSAGKLWTHGVDLDLDAVAAPHKGRKISLPAYAFEKKRYWIEPGEGDISSGKLRPASQTARLDKRADWFSDIQWKQKRLSPAAAPAAGAWLIFSDASPAAHALSEAAKARGAKVVTVAIGKEFTRTDDRFVVDPSDAGSYPRLFEAISEDGLSPDVIVHFWSLRYSGPGSAYSVFNSAFAICRRLQFAEGTSDRRLLFVTSGSQSVAGEPLPHPQRAMLVGVCRVAPREIPRLRVQVVDVDSPSEGHAGALLKEIDAGLTDELVAYRGEDRWTPDVSRAAQALASSPGRLRQNGTYLITGGLGDVGLLLADFLARAVSAKLVLIGRTRLPSRRRWRRIVQNEPHSRRAMRIRALMALEAAGVETLVIDANVANEAELDAALKKAKARFGRIDGAIHAAGTLRDAPIALKTADSIHEVVDAKVMGAENLHKLLPEGTVDFLAVFSSTSALVGLPGQIDYAGANAVAAAIAESRRDGVAIYWGAWADTGMAARSYGLAEPRGEDTGHPLLGLLDRDSGRAEFCATYDPSILWPMREHVVDGTPTLPASAYLEILSAAARMLGYRKGARIRNLSILAPMTFPENAARQIRISVKRETNGLDFVIESSSPHSHTIIEHARALVEPALLTPLPDIDADILREVGQVPIGEVLKAPQGDRLGFGPRWLNIRGLAQGNARATGAFVLPEQFRADQKAYSIHPALCDMAMSIGLSLLDTANDPDAFYAPMSIDGAEFVEALPSRFHSVATLVDRSEGVAVFNVEFIDGRQRPIGEIRGIAFRRLLHGAMGQSSAANDRRDAVLRQGLKASEAPSLFDRVLRSDRRSIVVSPTPIAAPVPRSAALSSDEMSSENPDRSCYADPVERALERIWCDLLGVGRVSPQDDFFALGGHSLIAVRLFARIRSEFNVDLPLASLFKAPRVPMLAKLVHDHVTDESTLPGAPAHSKHQDDAQETPAAQKTWTPVFNVRKGAAGKTPLFLLPGGDGGYFKLRELAPLLRDDWPIYVLRMRGLEDSLPPHESIEAIAAANIEGIRSVQPSGPYRLAGFSGGGVVAFEMARQLQDVDENVEALIMFDTLCPGADSKSRNLLRRIWAARLWSPSFALASARRLCGMPAGIVARRAGRAAVASSAPIGDEPDRSLENYTAIYQHYMRLQAQYKLRRLRSDLILLRASAVQSTWLVAGRCLGWDKWVDGRVRTHRVDCNHHTLFVQPAIGVVAKIVQQHLRDCDEARARGAANQSTDRAVAKISRGG